MTVSFAADGGAVSDVVWWQWVVVVWVPVSVVVSLVVAGVVRVRDGGGRGR